MPALPDHPSPEDQTADYERRFPRRLLFASATAGAAAIVAVGSAQSAGAATPTTTWKLGGNTDVASTNFLGAIGAGQNLIFKTRASSSATVSEKMRLTALGRLGLGTASPVAKLDVTTSSAISVQGKSTGTGEDARGVVGSATNGFGVLGTSTDNTGVRGDGGYYGGRFVGGNTGIDASGSAFGVTADSVNTAIFGTARRYGVYGFATSASGTNYGVYGGASSGYAVFAAGDARVTGTLSKSAGSFIIDHPLDPDNKWLSHSFVESPDMMNVYNGNVTTDVEGNATVALPSYFQALNRDFRYQLTVIGDFAQAVVSKEVANNAFAIKTDKPQVKVSWQVTGIRLDSYAKEHPIVVEAPKDATEKGTRMFVPKGSSAKAMQVGPMAPRSGPPAGVDSQLPQPQNPTEG